MHCAAVYGNLECIAALESTASELNVTIHLATRTFLSFTSIVLGTSASLEFAEVHLSVVRGRTLTPVFFMKFLHR